MRPELETYHLIDRYLSGQLSESERGAFEQRVSSDPAFAEEVATQTMVNQVVVGAGYQQIREQIAGDLAKREALDLRRKWAIGISVLLFALLVGAIWWLQQEKPDGKTSVAPSPTLTIVSVSPTPVEKKEQTPASKPLLPETRSNASNRSVQEALVPETPTQQLQPVHAAPTSSVLPSKRPEEGSQPALAHVQKSETVALPCPTMALLRPPSVIPACRGAEDGKILVQDPKVQGGTAPHSFGLKQEHEGTLRKGTAFYGLPSGTYALSIQDALGCEQWVEVLVPEQPCAGKHHSFQPDLGEAWELPVDAEQAYTLHILTRQGRSVYTAKVQPGQHHSWQGTASDGGSLEAGLYLYIIEYANGKKENGQITLLR